jgi:4-hydroxybenzoate polyprenyltransferase
MGADSADAGGIAWLGLASVCLYCGGMVLNDVCDFRRDQLNRRDRPLPGGAMTRTAAAWLAFGLLAAGGAAAWLVGGAPRWVGLGLVAAIIAYDAVLKNTPLAPGIMGACRALNLALGLSLVGSLDEPRAIYAMAIHWTYITSVTVFARKEAGGGSAVRLKAGAAGACLAIFAMVALPLVVDPVNAWYLLLVGILLGRIASPAVLASRTQQPQHIQAAVGVMIASVILFDACLVFAARGPVAAGAIVLLLLPVILLSGHSRRT